MDDWDIGEILLNFMLSEEVRNVFRVNVINANTEEEWEKDTSGGWEIWESKMM